MEDEKAVFGHSQGLRPNATEPLSVFLITASILTYGPLPLYEILPLYLFPWGRLRMTHKDVHV